MYYVSMAYWLAVLLITARVMWGAWRRLRAAARDVMAPLP